MRLAEDQATGGGPDAESKLFHHCTQSDANYNCLTELHEMKEEKEEEPATTVGYAAQPDIERTFGTFPEKTLCMYQGCQRQSHVFHRYYFREQTCSLLHEVCQQKQSSSFFDKMHGVQEHGH